MLHSLALFLVLGLSACGLLSDRTDDQTDWSVNKFYSEAREKLNDGSYAAAIKLYETLESRYPYGRIAQQAQLEIAYAHYKNDEPASAIAAADRFIKLHPNHANVDYAYYIKGLANFNEGWGMLGFLLKGPFKQDMSERDPKASYESFEVFKELVARFPESKYAADSRQRMAYLLNLLAMGEIHTARYYMKRKAYIAAANRAQNAVKEYPPTPATEEALYIMIRAYEALEMYDLRDDAERVMRINFPNSIFLAELPEVGAKAWWEFWKN
ncbi:MAG: outer membrane protein assembly factor BamD [Nitrosomonas sp.]|uniref:outer membrane protein assembly factor BamD n=1 Tax=Nitrosomonas sp. TaxID=42353 RepID=UPI0025E64654|nr:outer membrane protein assembly factor BamD [Nitrosomonas sp.]MBY0474273.1 outer membrane protein assembly factor BamD [Nitrosomonas sp.]